MLQKVESTHKKISANVDEILIKQLQHQQNLLTGIACSLLYCSMHTIIIDFRSTLCQDLNFFHIFWCVHYSIKKIIDRNFYVINFISEILFLWFMNKYSTEFVFTFVTIIIIIIIFKTFLPFSNLLYLCIDNKTTHVSHDIINMYVGKNSHIWA